MFKKRCGKRIMGATDPMVSSWDLNTLMSLKIYRAACTSLYMLTKGTCDTVCVTKVLSNLGQVLGTPPAASVLAAMQAALPEMHCRLRSRPNVL